LLIDAPEEPALALLPELAAFDDGALGVDEHALSANKMMKAEVRSMSHAMHFSCQRDLHCTIGNFLRESAGTSLPR
jgi:hypothetical protein